MKFWDRTKSRMGYKHIQQVPQLLGPVEEETEQEIKLITSKSKKEISIIHAYVCCLEKRLLYIQQDLEGQESQEVPAIRGRAKK